MYSRQLNADSTEKMRRGAVVLFPGSILTHLLFTYGIWPSLLNAHLVIAALMLLVGLSLRWIRRASLVLPITTIFLLYFFVYVGGVAPTLAYLTVSGHKEHLALGAAMSCAVYAVFLFYRVRVSLREEWSQSLELTRGVVVSRADQTLHHQNIQHHDQRTLSRVAIAMLTALAPALYFSRGTSAYLFVLFVVVSSCIGILLCFVVSWWIAYTIAVRRWERSNGVLLNLHPLSERDPAGE